MRLLITGASGFVGQALLRNSSWEGQLRLSQHQQPVLCKRAEIVQADLSQSGDCLRLCQGVDAIIHAAGSAGSAATAAQAALDGIVSNLVLTSRILQAASLQGVAKVLIFGSTTGYPELDREIHEEDMESGPPPDNYLGYGWMRRYLEQLGGYVSRQSKTRVVVLRPAAVYGPGDATTHVIPSLMQKAAQKLDPFEIWGTGAEERDFLHVDDLARACYLALERLEPGQPVHLASGEVVSIASLAQQILAISGHQPHQLLFLSDRPTNIRARRFNLEQAQQRLGFQAQIPLRQGIQQTWDWFRRKNA